ncbi:MAG: preprotein translocase subunit SecG [Xanthomonadales bacterium]|nr:preprotein translocase subunit SecG [Xanthomonadales bacterium]
MQILNIFHVLIAIAMVAFVLVQRGPGATAGAAFGSGASGTVFGSRGAGSFLSRATWVLATLFCLISLTMAVVVSRTVVTTEQDLGVVAEVPAARTTEVSDLPVDENAGPIGDSSDSDLPALDDGDGELPPLEEETAPEADEEGSGAGG